jgi:kynureninase
MTARAQRADPLAALRDAFELPRGRDLPRWHCSAAPAPARGCCRPWNTKGAGLITSWNDAGWIDLPGRIGGKIARLIGAQADEVIAVDSTSVNLFKLLAGALALRPQRRVIVSEAGNFPTDLYIAQGLASLRGAGHELRLVERERIADAIDEHTAVVMLTQVDYRSGSAGQWPQTALAHRAGALMLWDSAHSAARWRFRPLAPGLTGGRCGYKYLNGGPGAPAPSPQKRRCRRTFTSPCRAGSATPALSHSRPATGRRPASRACNAAPRRCSR